jgi:hypothetical protein
MSAEENAAAPVDGEGEEKRKFISWSLNAVLSFHFRSYDTIESIFVPFIDFWFDLLDSHFKKLEF